LLQACLLPSHRSTPPCHAHHGRHPRPVCARAHAAVARAARPARPLQHRRAARPHAPPLALRGRAGAPQRRARDVAAYLALEAQFDELLALRVERLPEQLPPATSAKLRAESARRSIAIYERGVIRLRGDVDFWLAYLAWARGRGMRVVAGRVAARALALFPNEHRLWIGCADDELRKSGIASARALLQRAIRLNTVPHERSAKRRRGEEGIAAPLVEPPTLRLSPKEMNLVALWVAYVRMELVFLERLRRRKAVLGLDGKDAAAKKELETAVTEEEVDEEEAAVLADVEAPTEPAPAAEAEVEASEATAQIVNGAIPLSLLSSSLASTSSLPPRTHYLFLLAFVALIRQFPFLPSPASDPKSALLAALNDALHARFEHPSSALLVASAPLLAAASPDPISDAAEELSEGTALASASTLHVSPPELQTLLEALPEGDESAQPLALAHELIVRAFSASADPHAVRSTLDALRLRLRSAPSPSLSGACVRLVCALRAAAEEPPMQAYLSGVARRIVSDARAQGHDAAVAAPALKLALEALSAQDGSKEEWKALHKEAMRACTRDADAETRLTRIAVREGLARARSEGKEVLEKEWSAVLALPGHEAEMWDAWTRWVSLEALDDAKWARNLLEVSSCCLALL
jgi:hypothetical protein